MIPDSEWAKSFSKEASWTRHAENNEIFAFSVAQAHFFREQRREGKTVQNFISQCDYLSNTFAFGKFFGMFITAGRTCSAEQVGLSAGADRSIGDCSLH